jgi:outer membrane protein TolC
MHRSVFSGYWLLASLLLSACATQPYRAPSTSCPAQTDVSPADAWWGTFGDSVLLALLAEADRCNVDRAHKALAVRFNRLGEGMQDGVTTKGAVLASEQSGLKGGAFRRHELEVSLSYEVDLWGRIARGQEAGAWLTRASEEDLLAWRLLLQAEVAAAYWQLVARMGQLQRQQEVVDLTGRLLQLEVRAAALGAARERDVRDRRQAWLAAQETREVLEAQAQRQRERLASLLDQPVLSPVAPSPSAELTETLPEVPADIPASRLLRRPDVAAGEARLRRQLALQDQARASLMPAMALTGSAGAINPALHQWLNQPFVALLGSLSLPFLNRDLHIARDQAGINVAIEVEGYRRLVNRALREVDDALASRRRLRVEEQYIQQQLSLARQAESEIDRRLRAGDVGHREPMEARVARLEQEKRLVEVRMERKINLAMLYKAVGGAPQ